MISEEASVEIDTLSMLVNRKKKIAEEIFQFELVGADSSASLPRFTAGAHVEVLTRNGLKRQYSLCNAPSDRTHYVIAVKREAGGKGGSISMADELAAGDKILVSAPKNYFALDPKATKCLFIAGGIGITPILSMVRDLAQRGGEFRLVYCTRSAETTAFLPELAEPAFARRTTVHHDHGDRSRSFDLSAVLAQREEGTHLYCCGPQPLMHAVREAARHWPSESVHFEDFSPTVKLGKPGDAQFVVHLARQHRDIDVPPGMSILDALRRNGMVVPSSCESGTCGTCRTRCLGGVPDHRDYILDEDETGEIMTCVSRARSDRLVLDL